MPHDCEPTGCFREPQRSRRIRSAPQDLPYLNFIPTSSTTTTTTTTTTKAPPQYLFSVISIPPDPTNAICPAIATTKPPMYFDAFGGDEKILFDDLIVHKYVNSGIFSIVPYNDSTFESVPIEVFFVGGGGGGGAFDGGGGGGAGQIKQSLYMFPKGNYTVIIGSGGLVGLNGQDTIIPEIGIKALGGGGGGSAFSDDAKQGASGGGAGGRSNSFGALGLRGNSGGASIGNVGGGGGGGAGFNGQSVPFIENGVTLNAGRGGDGIAVSYDGKRSFDYYGGGGAGDAFNNLIIGRSIGGGGGTLSKNGINGTGGGGAGNGGIGGNGFCVISYKPITTPPPSTTTTPQPRVPSIITNLTAIGQFQSIYLRWVAPTDPGTSDITSYTIDIFQDSQHIDTIVIPSESLNFVTIDDQEYITFTIEGLLDQVLYRIEIYSTNDVGDSESVVTSATTVTTTETTTTTIPPEYVKFIIETQGDLVNSYLETESVTISGPEKSIRTTTITIRAEGEYVFYETQNVSSFGDGATSIVSIDQAITEDKKAIVATVTVLMPEQIDTRALLYFVASATETTTTTTSTTTTTLPPLCSSIYHTAEFTQDGDIFIPPTNENRFLNPMQLFFGFEQFPAEITGSSSEAVLIAGDPWYNGTYFELQRPVTTFQSYIQGLPENHNTTLFVRSTVQEGPVYLGVLKYILKYPTVFENQILTNFSSVLYFNEFSNHIIRANVSLDYVCTVSNPNIYGKGAESVNGFTLLEIKETFGGQDNTLISTVINKQYFRTIGSFTSNFTGDTFYYMFDYGTRERIVGI